jgi:uncharacterized protein (DUF1697 family)
MTRFVAFLRGINLGRRQVKMAELKACLEEAGYEGVRTLLASGNVILEAESDKGLKAGLEEAMAVRFGFTIEVVLRTAAELAAMVEAQPFGHVPDGADVKRYVLLFDSAMKPLPKLEGVPGDFEVVCVDPREIYVVAHRLPSGRYGAGMDKLDQQLPKGCLVTTRNWNTILKAVN